MAAAQAPSGDWRLEKVDEQTMVKPRKAPKVSSFKLAADIATSGAGIALVPPFVAKSSIQSGELVRVLPDWHDGISEIHIVHPSRKLAAPRVRAFIDVLANTFREDLWPGWGRHEGVGADGSSAQLLTRARLNAPLHCGEQIACNEVC